MNLDTYLSEVDSNAGLAKKLGVAPSLISQWRNGVRPIPFERCPQIESVTNGLVTRQELCPDNWRELWPELAEQEKAREFVVASAEVFRSRNEFHDPPFKS